MPHVAPSPDYIDLMTPAFLEGMTVAQNQAEGSAEAPVLGWAACQTQVKLALREIDWEATGLQGRAITLEDGTEQERDPCGVAEHLADLAMSDAYDIIGFCNGFSSRIGMPECADFGRVLCQSKKTLLTLAGLSDWDKRLLVPVLKEWPHHQFSINGIKLQEEPVVLEKNAHAPLRFVWNNQVRDWINENRKKGAGCPALYKIIESPDGRKQPLIYYFWDTLISVMYTS